MREDIDAVLEELRQFVANARTMPMSASVMVNRIELMDFADRLSAEIDNTIGHAVTVVDQRDEVIEQGQTDAEEILRQAEREREELLSDTGIFRLAEGRAYELTHQAELEAEALRRETDQYVEQRLADFELTLERTLESVRRGRNKLIGGVVHDLGDDSDVAQIELPEHLQR